MVIDPDAPEHPYQQIADLLRSRLADGTYPAGRKLPTVLVLAAETGVSHMTVRRALAVLKSEGAVLIVPGRGTFAAAAPEPSCGPR